MSPPTPADPASPAPEPRKWARPRWQIGLRGLGVLLLAAALWLTAVANRREIARLEARIATLRPIARELVVTDPAKFAVVLRAPRWVDENAWDVSIPDGTYRLCLATREVDTDRRNKPGPSPPNLLAPVLKSMPIGPGRHRVEMEIKRDEAGGYKLAFGFDGSARVEVVEPKEWGADSSSGGAEFRDTEQLPADRPLVLFRRRFMRPNNTGGTSDPAGPTEGVLLWIERTAGPP